MFFPCLYLLGLQTHNIIQSKLNFLLLIAGRSCSLEDSAVECEQWGILLFISSIWFLVVDCRGCTKHFKFKMPHFRTFPLELLGVILQYINLFYSSSSSSSLPEMLLTLKWFWLYFKFEIKAFGAWAVPGILVQCWNISSEVQISHFRLNSKRTTGRLHLNTNFSLRIVMQ